MSYELKSATPKDNRLPEPLAIFIDGKECGDCTPSLSGGRLQWHSCIKLKTIGLLGSYLVQGFGATPEQAIADSIVSARRERAAILELSAWLENQLGTVGKLDGDLLTGSDE